jgi:hypothetical protein
VVKGLYGLGRGVFEGSCRAVYAEMFTGQELSTAFSGQTLLAGFSGGLCFFLYSLLSKASIASITIGNGILAIVAYGVLMSVDYRQPISWSQLCVLLSGRALQAKDTKDTKTSRLLDQDFLFEQSRQKL